MKKIVLLILAIFSYSNALDLTLQKAKEMALKNNDNMKISKNLKEKSQYTYDEAFSYALPKIDASLGYMRNIYSPEIPDPEYYFTEMGNELIKHTNYHIGMAQASGNTSDPYYSVPMMDTIPTGNTTKNVLTNNDISAGVNIIQPIWTGGKVFSAINIAKNYKQMSDLEYQNRIDSTKTEVEKSFYTVLMLKESVNIIKKIQNLRKNHLTQVNNLFKNGLMSEYDVLRAKIGIRQIDPKVLELENKLSLATTSLKAKIGLSFNTKINILGKVGVDSLFQIDSNYYELVVKNRKELLILDQVSQMRKENINIKKAGFKPTIAAVVGYKFIAKNNDLSNTFKDGHNLFSTEKGMNFLSAGIQVSIPIYSGGETVAKTAKSRIDYDNSILQYKKVKKLLKLQVDQSIKTIRANRLKLKIQKEVLGETKKALEIANNRFKNGIGTQLDYFDAQSELESASLTYLQIKLKLRIAQTNYKYFTGQVE